MSLIPESAKRDLEKQDARRAKARQTASPDQFRQAFTRDFARDIELIRRGAIVTDVDSEGRVLAVKMPDGKSVPTVGQAKRTLWWSRCRRFFSRLRYAFSSFGRSFKAAWKGW